MTGDAWLRVLQYLPIPFIFIPTTTAAYIGVPAEKNNSVAGLVNFMRNIGSGVGTSIVTTLIARQSQFHQVHLVSRLADDNPSFQAQLGDMVHRLAAAGLGTWEAQRQAYARFYEVVLTVDSEPLGVAVKALAEGKDLPTALKSGGPPNMKKRGTVRTVFDGRYKFTRYFGPEDRNRPAALDELYRDNDVELFDLETDPGEMTNLAAVKGEHRDLVLAMSTKLEALIKREIGVDDGREMPPLAGVNWTIDVKGNEAILD